MSSRRHDTHGLVCAAIAGLAACVAFCAKPALGQVYNAHVGKDERDVDPNYCPHELTLAIAGQVRTVDNSPLPQNVVVRLETTEGAFSAQQVVGPDGRFRFLGVAGNSYRVVVRAKGFQPASKEVEEEWGASYSPTIDLHPSVEKDAGPPVEIATDRAAPKQARREYEAGFRELGGGNLEEARKHLEKAVGADPCYARAQTALGVTLAKQHELAGAESAFHKAIECDAGFAETYLQLAILLKGGKKSQECETTLEEGLRRFPNDWRLHYQLGNIKADSGDYEAADQEFVKAQSLNADLPPEFHVRLAELYRDWKKYDKARAQVETYLHDNPRGPLAEPARRMMEELEASGAVTMGSGQAAAAKP
ncbi:MAG: carboxypeptidase regulatory-like domain-containing protein [Acidobacteriia bacterium]|nr:carboxypeptidase regulatory-like domain-containing protein [Terriglobia bacterium]